MDRLDLLAQLIRHGRAIGLVFSVYVVAEGGALGIEYHDHLIARVIGHQLSDHADYPFGRAGVQTLGVRKCGQGVISAKQIRRSVHQNEPIYHQVSAPTRTAQSVRLPAFWECREAHGKIRGSHRGG